MLGKERGKGHKKEQRRDTGSLLREVDGGKGREMISTQCIHHQGRDW